MGGKLGTVAKRMLECIENVTILDAYIVELERNDSGDPAVGKLLCMTNVSYHQNRTTLRRSIVVLCQCGSRKAKICQTTKNDFLTNSFGFSKRFFK